ncbi:MAG: SCO family protein [Pseudomonadota bacterium]
MPLLADGIHRDLPLPVSLASLPFEDDTEHLLVFVGYPGCPTACPTTLRELSRLLATPDAPRAQVVFLNLLENVPSGEATRYARAIDPRFLAATALPTDRPALVRTFGVPPGGDINSVARHAPRVYRFRREASRWLLTEVHETTSLDAMMSRLVERPEAI